MKSLHFNQLAAASLIALCALPTLATTTLQNGYVLAGVNNQGTLGSGENASPGILFDKTGTSTYGVNDFLTPGTPFEGFYITASGGYSQFSNNTLTGYHGGTTFVASAPTSLTPLSATWTGTSVDGTLTVSNTYTLTTESGRSAISISSVLTNNARTALTNLQFLRTTDPDPDVNAFNSFVTNNTVVSSNEACATGSQSGETICILSNSSFAHNAGVSGYSGVDGLWSRLPSDYLNGLNNGNGDYAIGVGFALGTLAPGASVDVEYAYALGESIEVVVPSVPEPGTYAMMGLGLAGLGAWARKRKPALSVRR